MTNSEKNQKKTILVTGGAGFIGSHLCERLVKDGHKVISLDNYFTGSKDNHVAGVEYREGHTKDIEKHVSETPDIIYHLGEYSRVAASLDEPELVWDLNMDGTFGVLKFWRDRGSKLVYAGSSTKFTAARADGVEGKNLAPYTWAKATNTELVVNFGLWYGLPYAITYFYNVYGPRERSIENYGTVVETFRQRFLQGKPLEVRSPGIQERSFTHVDDTVEGLILAGERGEGDEYGIGAKDSYTLLQLAELFGGEVVMLPQTKSTRSSSDVDSTKIEALGWRPKHSLQKYVEEVKASKK